MNFHSNDNRSAEPVNSGMTGGPPVSRWPCAQTVTAMRGRSWETFSTMMESSGPSRRRPHRIGSVVSSRRNRFEVKRHELLDHLRPPHDLLESWKWRLGSGAASTVKSITGLRARFVHNSGLSRFVREGSNATNNSSFTTPTLNETFTGQASAEPPIAESILY